MLQSNCPSVYGHTETYPWVHYHHAVTYECALHCGREWGKYSYLFFLKKWITPLHFIKIKYENHAAIGIPCKIFNTAQKFQQSTPSPYGLFLPSNKVHFNPANGFLHLGCCCCFYTTRPSYSWINKMEICAGSSTECETLSHSSLGI